MSFILRPPGSRRPPRKVPPKPGRRSLLDRLVAATRLHPVYAGLAAAAFLAACGMWSHLATVPPCLLIEHMIARLAGWSGEA